MTAERELELACLRELGERRGQPFETLKEKAARLEAAALGPVTRYLCPLPGCGWTRDVLPSDGPMGVELALRQHADSHSALEYVRALTAAQEQTGTTTSAWRVEAGYGDQWRHAGGPFTNRATAVDHLDWCRSLAGPSVTHRLVRDDTTHTSTVEEA